MKTTKYTLSMGYRHTFATKQGQLYLYRVTVGRKPKELWTTMYKLYNWELLR